MVNLALSNGQVVTTSLANLQAMAQTNLFAGANNPGQYTININSKKQRICKIRFI